MPELGGWGVVAVVVVGGFLVLRIASYLRRRVRRKARAMLIALVLSSYLGVGAGALNLGGYFDGSRCAGASGAQLSVSNAPAHLMCAGIDKFRSAKSDMSTVPGLSKLSGGDSE